MDTGVLDILRATAPEYVTFIVVIVTLAYAAGLLRNAFQGLPSLLQFRPTSVKRAAQREEMAFITEQLKDSGLREESRRFLEVRRAELVVSLTRGVDLPWNIQEQLIHLSTDEHLDGVSWWLFREVQRRIIYLNGKIHVNTTNIWIILTVFLLGIALIGWATFSLLAALTTGTLQTLAGGGLIADGIAIVVGVALLRSTIGDVLAKYVAYTVEVLYARLVLERDAEQSAIRVEENS